MIGKPTGIVMVGVAALLASTSASAAEIPAGTEIPNGIVVHMTPKGVHFMESQVAAIVPPMISPAQIGPSNYFSCLFDHASYTVKNIHVYLQVGKVVITPMEGKLKLHLEINVSADARLDSSGCLLDFGCTVSLDPSPV